jgi:predicted amidohydrolase YtcJ
MLIRRAQIDFSRLHDLRVEHGRVAVIGQGLAPQDGEAVVEANGCALLPGLRDHHLHLASLAAARASLRCGPPQVHDAAALQALLAAQAGGSGWVRGIGYHESVAGDIDRHWLDRALPDRPVRIQHRGGRLWVLNSRALELLEIRDSDPLERERGQPSGRLYDNDPWLRQRMGRGRPDLAEVSRHLASRGVTGLTDTSPGNGIGEARWLRQAQRRGELLQDLLLMGGEELDRSGADEDSPDHGRPWLAIGAHKFHLHEAHLPEYAAVCADIRRAHAAGRGAAFHCVTRTELVYALGALREAGLSVLDRIEHASVAPPELLQAIRELGLTVVSQPGFIAERGDAYLAQVEAADQPWLYRLRGFLEAGVPLAGSTDAPFGEADPWAAMQAAVTRRSAAGQVLGPAEALTPEQALALFTTPLRTPGRAAPRIEPGMTADLCLLDRDWPTAAADLAAVRPCLTLRAGTAIHSSLDANSLSRVRGP